MRPRLVATDLDGTIVRSDWTISPRVVRALQRVETLGVPVVFVTGRPPRWMAEISEQTGHTGLAICANGGVVWDLREQRVVATYPLAVEVGLEVVRRLRAAIPDLGFAIEREDGFAHERAFRPRVEPPEETPAEDILDVFAEPAVKLLARHEQLQPEDLYAAGREVVGDLAEVTHSSSSAMLEISAAGVSKATTLALLCEERGIDAADVVAFGDMPNDLPLLAWAGRPYAMANAHPDVLAAIPSRAPSVEDDGVAVVLETLFAD